MRLKFEYSVLSFLTFDQDESRVKGTFKNLKYIYCCNTTTPLPFKTRCTKERKNNSVSIGIPKPHLYISFLILFMRDKQPLYSPWFLTDVHLGQTSFARLSCFAGHYYGLLCCPTPIKKCARFTLRKHHASTASINRPSRRRKHLAAGTAVGIESGVAYWRQKCVSSWFEKIKK